MHSGDSESQGETEFRERNVDEERKEAWSLEDRNREKQLMRTRRQTGQCPEDKIQLSQARWLDQELGQSELGLEFEVEFRTYSFRRGCQSGG